MKYGRVFGAECAEHSFAVTETLLRVVHIDRGQRDEIDVSKNFRCSTSPAERKRPMDLPLTPRPGANS